MHFSAQSACHSPEYRSAAANAARKRGGPMRRADAMLKPRSARHASRFATVWT